MQSRKLTRKRLSGRGSSGRPAKRRSGPSRKRPSKRRRKKLQRPIKLRGSCSVRLRLSLQWCCLSRRSSFRLRTIPRPKNCWLPEIMTVLRRCSERLADTRTRQSAHQNAGTRRLRAYKHKERAQRLLLYLENLLDIKMRTSAALRYGMILQNGAPLAQDSTPLSV